jgi:hypothetical protein
MVGKRAFAEIVMQFGAGAAGTGVAHGPKIVRFVQAQYLIFRNAFLCMPDIPGNIIITEHGHPEPLWVHTEVPCEQFPGKMDRFFLEIIAEREVAQHFKKSMMAERMSHILEIVVLAAYPHAFLTGGGSPVWSGLVSQKDILELVHARIRE